MLAPKPKQGTPTLMTSAAAYSHFGRAMQGLWIPRNCVRRIPLWCSRVFLTAQGRPCFCRALSKARVLTVGDIISPSGDIYAHLLAKVARAFRDLYERQLTLMATAIKNGTGVQMPGRTLPELESWSMRELSYMGVGQGGGGGVGTTAHPSFFNFAPPRRIIWGFPL